MSRDLVESGKGHWFEKVTSLLEQNIRGVQIGIYTVAFTGLAIALRSVRPFKKFSHPAQIPSSFFQKHVKLSGKVLRIDFNPKPYLVVDHVPIIGGSLRKQGLGLPVNIDGVDVSTNGISWLQSVLVGHKVEFTLVSRQPTSASCIITHKNKNIANTLVSIGFASVGTFNMALENDILYKKYYQSLLKDEVKAEKNGVGMWWERNPSISTKLINLMFSKFPTRLRV